MTQPLLRVAGVTLAYDGARAQAMCSSTAA